MHTTLSPQLRPDADEARLVGEHLSLVQHAVSDIAGRLPRHVCRDDLVSAAMLGLAQAARTFDPSRGVAFERHAWNRIRGALLDELRQSDWASRSVRASARRLQAANDAVTARVGRTASATEAAAELGVEVAEVHDLLGDIHRATVLNYESVLVEGEATNLLPSSEEGPDEMVLRHELHAHLVAAVLALPERLRTVVVGYFLDERSMQDLADQLGVSESRISQLRAQAVGLLRDGLNSQLDPDRLAPEPRPGGRVARRKAAYYAAIAATSATRAAGTVPGQQRTPAATGVRLVREP